MGRWLTTWLVLIVLVGSFARGADDPRTLIEKAIAAQGAAGHDAATVTRIKGGMFGPVEGATYSGTLTIEPAGRTLMTLQVEVAGNRISVAQCLDGNRGWKSVNGAVEDMTAEEIKEMQRSIYVDQVTSLVSLLKDKRFTLEPLGESTVGKQSLQGVKVVSEGHSPVSLYFDRETHLLVKFTQIEKNPGTGKAALQETILSDFTVLNLQKDDEDTLKLAKVAVDGPSLLEFLIKRKPKKLDEDQVKALIKLLGDEEFAVREKAAADLMALGTVAAPLLRQATKNEDTEIARRAESCLKAIGEKGSVAALVPAAIRLVGWRKPEGAAAVLLDFACQAGDVETSREARWALMAVALRDGKPDPTLAAALEDKDPVRRALAQAALGKDDGQGAKEPGRRLYLERVKVPMKAVVWLDGAKSLDREMVEVHFFTRFDDSVFARPR